MVRPASSEMSTSLVASSTSVTPQALKNSLLPPKVPVPRQRAGTLKPEPPSCLNSTMNAPTYYLDVNKNTKYSRPLSDPGNLVLKQFSGARIGRFAFCKT